jgi:pimeloyl-ACP methyl ester carboxylesterase
VSVGPNQDGRGSSDRTEHAGLTEVLSSTRRPSCSVRVRLDNVFGGALESLFAYREDLTMDHLAMPIVAVDADRRPVALDHNRAHAPQFDARILKDTGHWLMLDKPTEFANTLRDVIESIESGKAKRRPM